MRKENRRISRYGRRALSLLLCVGMLSSTIQGASVQAAAPGMDKAKHLASSRISKDKLPEGDIIYLGTAAATVEEKGEYAVKLYREGNLEKEASVGLHTIDLTAVYGKDYELVMEDVTRTGNGRSILENYVKGREITHIENLEESVLQEQEAVPLVQEDASNTQEDASGSAASVSTLAKEKEQQTGQKSRELADTEDQGLMDELLGEAVAESMQQLEYSSESTVTFEKGESEKVVRFRILEDDEAEGMEGFSLLLVNPEGAELYEVTSLSISIQDAQETEHSEVSFTEAAYTSEDGKAVVTVERTGAEYSVCEMALRTSGVSAVAGTNYEEKNELVSFAPYETEKEIEMDVAGSGTFQVMLTDLKACEEGAYTKAVVAIDENKDSSLELKEDAVRTAAAGLSFDINIKGHLYTVEYTKGDATGRIMDNDYQPAVEAGTYYFAADAAHGGMFEYGFVGGNMPNACGVRASDYQSDGTYGRLKYYNSNLGKPGWVYCRIQDMPGVYYSYFIPDWDTTGSTDGGQRKIEIPGVDTVYSHGAAKRTQDQNAVVNLENGKLTANIYAYDDKGKMRKSYVKLYGLCAMNRKFNISMEAVEPLTFRTGEAGSSITTPSMQVEVDCGAQPKDANIDTRDIYANQDPEKSNLVFSVKDTHVNGHNGIFGHIEGYQITIDPGKGSDAIRKLNYPEDFETWLKDASIPKPSAQNASGGGRSVINVTKDHSVLTRTEVDTEIKKVRSNLAVVPYDKYFLRWIGEMQGGDTASDPLSYGYKQNLKFKPVLAHNDITVEVLPAAGEGGGHFTDTQLSQTGKYTFHEGDTITLDAVADNPDKYEVTGYEFSTDGISFDKITSTRQLFLDGSGDKDYYRIRPVIAEKTNAIEIHMDASAKSHLEIQGLIPQSDLEKLGTDYNYLKGRYFLNVNPKGKTALEKMTPVSGKEYMIRILEKDGGTGKVAYRPTVKKKSGNTTYTTKLFQFIAESDGRDNIYEIGVSEVERAKLKKYTVSGDLTSSFAPIRDNATVPQSLPVTGYTLSIGTGTQNVDKNKKPYAESYSAVTDMEGHYELNNIMGVAGDVIPVLASNGITNGQIIEVKLTDTNEDKEKGCYMVSQGNTRIGYPSQAPRVRSIDYTYDNPSHVQSNGGVAPNSVHIYDDIFTVTAIVDTYGRNVKEAVFTVYTVTGKTTQYHASEDPNNKNHFVCKIPGMADSFFNGDRIKVRLVDSERMYSGAGKDWDGSDILNNEGEPVTGIDWNIEYPDVDTGLVFFVENVLTQPKYYDVKDDSISADIPLLGNATSSTQSGLLTFGKSRWADGNGYSLQIGANFAMGNTGQPSGMDKGALYENFTNAVRSDKANAEEIILGKKEGSTKEETDLKAEKKEVENKVKEMKNDSSSKAKGAVAKMNEKEPMWQVDTAVVLVFDFLYNPEIGDFQFISGGVAVGGTVTFNMTAYTLVASVPTFLNFSATLQANLTVAYSTKEGMTAMTAGDFDQYSGNLAERLSSQAKATQSIMASGKIQVGVGLCGVLSARGYVSLKIQFDINMGDLGANGKRGGVLIGSAGGIGFDLLFISINMDFYSVTKGWGSLENRTSYNFFGGLLDESDLGIEDGRQVSQVFSLNKGNAGDSATQAFSLNENGDKILRAYSGNERLVEHEYDMGSSDLSGFGRSSMVRATPGLVRVNTLLDNAAEHTRPQIIALDDSNTKKMVLFIGSRRTDEDSNSAALYYSVYDGISWGMPKIVAEDGTIDTMPSVIRGTGADGKEKVMIAWADADRAFTAEDSTVDKLNALGISAAVYDIESNTMGEEIVMVEDKYCNLSPKLQTAEGKLYVSYMKRDLGTVQEEEDLLDFGDVYSTMAYLAYDLEKKQFVSGIAQSPEELIAVHHPTLSDPLVMDYQVVTTELDGDVYMLCAYTVDNDTNLETKEDRELWLGINNITKDREYYPIQITSDTLSQSNPRLTDIDGTVYLTWLEEGYLFRLMDATEVLEALFGTSTEKIEISASESDDGQAVSISIGKDVYRSGYIPSGTSAENATKNYKDWYKKSAADLGITDAAYYDESIYEQLATGTLQADGTNFSQREGMQTSVSNYTLTSNGKDIYIFFTDFGTKDEKSTGVEIYGVCYRRWQGEGDSIDLAQDWGFGKAVQITDNGKVIDELSLYMDRESNISAVSNYYEQYINENGGMSYSANKLVEIEFETRGSIEVEDGYIGLPDSLVGGETAHVTFDVVNNGLLAAEGFAYKMYQIQNGTQTLVDSGEVQTALASGEKEQVTAFWKLPENLSDTQIMVEVQETGVAQETVNSATIRVPYSSNLEFTDAQILWKDTQPYLSVSVKNTGNAETKPYQASLGLCNEEGKMGKLYGTVDIPKLASGEERSFEFTFMPQVDDFAENMGIIRLKCAVMDGTKTVAETNTRLTSMKPVCAQINDGKKIALAYGKTTALTVKAAPWNGIAGKVRFYSTNADVASVDDKGIVTGTGNGEAKIYVYYPASGVTASIDVSVTGKPAPGKPETPGDNNKAKAGTKKIALKKTTAVLAPGKSASIGFTAQKESKAPKAEKVTVSVSGKSVVSKAVIKGGKVTITAAKKAVRGNSTTVTLKSKTSAGKIVSAKIKVTIQNQTKKVTAKKGTSKKKPITVKKGKKVNVVLNVTAQNKKKATTDTVKVSSNIVKLVKSSIKKGKITLSLKGKKKGTKRVTIKVGKKSVRIYIKVK